MNYLLDSCALLWWISGSPNIGPKTIQHLNDSRNRIYVSAASIWEIYIKIFIKKLHVEGDILKTIQTLDFIHLPINFEHGKTAASLPLIHKDPFDRMLVAQASVEGLVLVTSDKVIPQYEVSVHDPRS